MSEFVFYRRIQGKETGMGSLIEELRRREDAARAEADRRRSRIEELSGDLAGAARSSGRGSGRRHTTLVQRTGRRRVDDPRP
jgi:hypothetical protein